MIGYVYPMIYIGDIGWMLKSMTIYQRNSKGIVKSNFVTSCLAFGGSISIVWLLLIVSNLLVCHWSSFGGLIFTIHPLVYYSVLT